MQVLISDANILIDLEEGRLLETLFHLPWQIRTPDLLFADELEEQHGNLLEQGLQLGELTPAGIADAETLAQHYPRISRYDAAALALARQDRCPLITGDSDLRDAAEAEKVVVAGTVWLVEAMVHHGLISIANARVAYRHMEAAHRRLPWDRAHRRLAELARGELRVRDPFSE